MLHYKLTKHFRYTGFTSLLNLLCVFRDPSARINRLLLLLLISADSVPANLILDRSRFSACVKLSFIIYFSLTFTGEK